MEFVNLALYTLIAVAFLFLMLANLSSSHSIRIRWSLGYIVSGIFFFVFLVFTDKNRAAFDFTELFMLFLGLGLAWPQLISLLILQQRIETPVTYLQNKTPVITILVIITLLLFETAMMLHFNTYNLSDGEPVIDKHFFYSRVSVLLAMIPFVIFSFMFLIQRTALCGNGLFYNGILWDWTSFKTYSWKHDQVYKVVEIQPILDKNTLVELRLKPKRILFTKEIRLMIPYPDKEPVNQLLSKHIPQE